MASPESRVDGDIYENVISQTKRLQRAFAEIDAFFQITTSNVTLVESFRLTDALGIKVALDASDSQQPLIVNSICGEAAVNYSNPTTVFAQIKTITDSEPVQISISNSPAFILKPKDIHKKDLPGLLKADLRHYLVLTKENLPVILEYCGNYKVVEQDDLKFYFDVNLDWLIEEHIPLIILRTKTKKYGLWKKLEGKLYLYPPSLLTEQLKIALKKEIALVDGALKEDSFTEKRKQLQELEIETDVIAIECLE